MPRRVRVINAGDPVPQPRRTVIATTVNPKPNTMLTENEKKARRLFATTTSMGFGRSQGLGNIRLAGDVMDTGQAQFYSPQLSTDFLEKPQNLRERRAFYRFFYNTNEIIGQAIDVHSTLPLSKLRLVPPKGKNKHQNQYVYKFFLNMCENMRLFKTLIEITHEYFLFGNCAHRDAEIRTLHGYKKASEVLEGDLLLTHEGRFRKVIGRTVRPSEEILRIKCFKDFRDVPITAEHPVEIYRDGEFAFETAENLSTSDYVRVTWPTETEDIAEIPLSFENWVKVDGGYELKIKIPHKRAPQAVEDRKKIYEWLGGLKEPVVKTRQQLSDELGIPLKIFNNLIFLIGQELDVKFHERLGGAGWQKGSQVRWLPIDTRGLEVTEDYTITTSKILLATDKLQIDNDFAYLAGYWFGDGTLARDSSRVTWGRGMWQIGSASKDNIDRLRGILTRIFGEHAITEWTTKDLFYIKVISNPAFIEWWADNFGETSFGQNRKKVPNWFAKLPQEKLFHFIAGLVDSDGCAASGAGYNKHNTAVISMASRVVMDAVRDILLKCGIVVSYGVTKERDTTLPNGKKVTSRKMYNLTASDEESCQLMVSQANKKFSEDAHFSDMERYYIRTDEGMAFKIRSVVTEAYNDLVYNFEVEEDHTFQVAGFSTHNCFIYAQQQEWKDGYSETELAQQVEQAKQRSEFLKEKYQIIDKNPLFKGWEKLIVLPPDQVRVRKLPLSDDVAVEYMPDPETRRFMTSDIPYDPNDPTKQIKSTIPEELKEKVRRSGVVPLDTDPYTGSHVYHLARKKSQYEPLGVSIVERCVNTVVLMDKIRQAQTSIASRHMTPMRIVWAEDLNDDGVDNLREQVDMALVDPDYSIIANYEIHWEEMGSQGRLLDISAEDEANMNRLFAGLGVTREVLTGEGTYTGSKISLEIMNQMYLLYREQLQDYVENYIFKPIAKKKGFVEFDEYGNEILLYPKLSFTRLAIRDNEQFFDAAFQLYQKGSLSIDLILDILNIDPDSTKEKLEADLFTVNDSIFNEVLRNLYTSAAQPLVEKTDIVQKLADYMKLEMTEEGAEGSSRFSSDPERRQKLMKVMKYFSTNPAALDKVFAKKESE